MLREVFISHGARLKRKRASTITSKVSHEFELIHKLNTDVSIFQLLQKKQAKLRSQLDQAFLKYRECVQQVIYEHGNKCSKALARSISKKNLGAIFQRFDVHIEALFMLLNK